MLSQEMLDFLANNASQTVIDKFLSDLAKNQRDPHQIIDKKLKQEFQHKLNDKDKTIQALGEENYLLRSELSKANIDVPDEIIQVQYQTDFNKQQNDVNLLVEENDTESVVEQPVVPVIEEIDIDEDQASILIRWLQNLSNCQLKIKTELCHARKLTLSNIAYITELFLQNNQLNSLPKEINSLANLRVLSLQGNQFEILPPQLKYMKLDKIILTDNPLQNNVKNTIIINQLKINNPQIIIDSNSIK